MTDDKKKEFTLRISQANASQLVLITYELFFFYIEEAKEYCEKKDYKAYSAELGKAHNCLNELIGSLRTDSDSEDVRELARTILKVYFYVSSRLGAAAGSRKKEPLEEAEKLMRRLCEIYETDTAEDTSEPVMGHTQTVYAGLTYGKNDININLEDGSKNRGFYA